LQHTGAPDEERTWHVFLDAEGKALGALVEDSGRGLEPEGRVTVEAQRVDGGVRIAVQREGAPPTLRRRVVVHDGPLTVEHVDDALDDVVVSWAR
jgi:hypothetical protein